MPSYLTFLCTQSGLAASFQVEGHSGINESGSTEPKKQEASNIDRLEAGVFKSTVGAPAFFLRDPSITSAAIGRT